MASRGRAWSDTITNTVLTNDQAPTDLLAGAPTVDTITVIRILIDVSVVLADGFESSNSLMHLSMGVGVTAKEAFDADALPNVGTTSEYPPRGWLFAGSQIVYNAPALNSAYVHGHFKADIRSQRKVDKGVLFLKIKSTLSQNSQATTMWVGRIRVLCLT